MAQKIRNRQYTMLVNGVERVVSIKTGSFVMSLPSGEGDASRDTGVPKFTGGFIAGGLTENWQQTTWDYTIDAWTVAQGTTNITVSVHTYSNGNSNIDIKWWAIGYDA